jgi:hypothetical protein
VAFAPKVAITSTVNINFFILFSPFYYKSSITSSTVLAQSMALPARHSTPSNDVTMTNFVAAFSLIISVVGISLTAIVQVKSEAHDKELYQKFKQDIDNEVADMRDLLRQHIMLSHLHQMLPLLVPLILIFSFCFLHFIKSRLSHH